ncbi:MAG: hypothetical protein EXR87_03095 [Gammaproteobacteria bacterium]|nr:hypothetical protein [Gammaproteobacteria bacterium]
MNSFITASAMLLAATTAQAADQPPDCTGAEYRQFDFWIGEFDVRSPDSQLAGHNVIEPTLKGCVLTEHWTGADGSEGRSVNFYDRREQRWNQVWIDDRGGVLRLAGGIVDGSMLLEGTTRRKDGATQLQRIRWTPNPDASVRQHWESSTDDGATWATVFDGIYQPRK